jgi:hypothetical protein
MAPRVEAFHSSMARLFSELVAGPPHDDAYMLNPGDAGLLRSLDKIGAAAASRPASAGGASIAAHVDHICYGLQLLNQWSGGDPNPWATADWAASWTRGTVDDNGWAELRSRLANEARRWQQALEQPRDFSDVELNGVIGSIAHLAYHLGAIRQIDASAQGPKAT